MIFFSFLFDRLYSLLHIHISENTNSFLQNFLLMKSAKIRNICVSLIRLLLQENDYNMSIDIHVVNGDRLNTNTLQQAV